MLAHHLLRLAWRNLWRNHRRTIIMLAAISTRYVWAMIFMTALMRGMVSMQMVKDGISALPGHVQVHHPDYRDDPSIANLIPHSATPRHSPQIFDEADLAECLGKPRTCAGGDHERTRVARVTLLGIDPVTLSAPDVRVTMHRRRPVS